MFILLNILNINNILKIIWKQHSIVNSVIFGIFVKSMIDIHFNKNKHQLKFNYSKPPSIFNLLIYLQIKYLTHIYNELFI